MQTHAVLFSFVLFIFSFMEFLYLCCCTFSIHIPPSFYLHLSLPLIHVRPSSHPQPSVELFFYSQLFILLFFFFLIPLCDPNPPVNFGHWRILPLVVCFAVQSRIDTKNQRSIFVYNPNLDIDVHAHCFHRRSISSCLKGIVTVLNNKIAFCEHIPAYNLIMSICLTELCECVWCV